MLGRGFVQSHNRINYIEFSCYGLEQKQAFYGAAFGWVFQAYGPDYIGYRALADSDTEQGGLYRAPAKQSPSKTQIPAPRRWFCTAAIWTQRSLR
jgi:predicted enzyme related to lactoylglutathione lyase